MKKLFFLYLLLLAGHTLRAQTFEEWFRQKKTQKEYLVQQIAALQAYSGSLRQGYAIVRQGLTTVQSIKQGDLGLHQDFFSSLRAVNPAITRLSLAGEMTACLAGLQHAFDQAADLPQLQAPERAYLRQVEASTLTQGAGYLEELVLLLTDGEQELRDAARIDRIRRLQATTLDLFELAHSFLAEVHQLAGLRARQGRDLTRLQDLTTSSYTTRP